MLFRSVGREPDLRTLAPELEQDEVSAHHRAHRVRLVWRYLASFAEETGRSLRLVLIAFFALFSVCAAAQDKPRSLPN